MPLGKALRSISFLKWEGEFGRCALNTICPRLFITFTATGAVQGIMPLTTTELENGLEPKKIPLVIFIIIYRNLKNKLKLSSPKKPGN